MLASNPDAALREHAEADTYWCFLLLMAEFRDNFIKTLDDSDTGIGSLMTRFSRALGRYDGEVKASLDEKGIKPMFYGFRWLTCLLSQEFPLPDVIRLWDSLFSKRDRQEYLICICCSLVCIVRSAIISSGVSPCVCVSMSCRQNVDATEECVYWVFSVAHFFVCCLLLT